MNNIAKDRLDTAIAGYVITEEFRAHMWRVVQNKNPELAQADNFKYFKSVFEVIPTELVKIFAKVQERSEDEYYKEIDNVISVAKEGFENQYKSLESYTQSNWNYFMLRNALNRAVMQKSINNVDELVNKTYNTIMKKEYSQYKKFLEKAKHDISIYFKELDLGDFIRHMKDNYENIRKARERATTILQEHHKNKNKQIKWNTYLNTISYDITYESSPQKIIKIMHILPLASKNERIQIDNCIYECCLDNLLGAGWVKHSTFIPMMWYLARSEEEGSRLCFLQNNTENVDFGDIETKLRKLVDKIHIDNMPVLELLYILRELPTINSKTYKTRNELIRNGTDIKDLALYGWTTNYTEQNVSRHLENLKKYFEKKNKRKYLLTQGDHIHKLIQDCIGEVNQLYKRLKNVG